MLAAVDGAGRRDIGNNLVRRLRGMSAAVVGGQAASSGHLLPLRLIHSGSTSVAAGYLLLRGYKTSPSSASGPPSRPLQPIVLQYIPGERMSRDSSASRPHFPPLLPLPNTSRAELSASQRLPAASDVGHTSPKLATHRSLSSRHRLSGYCCCRGCVGPRRRRPRLGRVEEYR